MPTHSSSILCRPAASAGAQIERPYSRNMISLVLMSALLISPLPVLGQSSATSVANRGESLLAFDIKDIIPMGRKVRRSRRIPETPSQRPSRNRILDGYQTPIQVPSNSLPGNRQLRQPQSTDPVKQQEQQYVNSLSPEERQVYEIIQKAKRDLRHQPIADFLGSGLGITPKGTTQTPQDLDREFQNAIRDSNNSTSSQPPVNNGSVAPGTRPGNRILQRILNKRSNETHEQWYARIDPVISHTPGEEYRAWKATLSSADNKAYNALVQKENEQTRKRMQEASGVVTDMIKRDLSCRWVLDTNGDYVKVCND
ncbi:hypothetical protein NIES4071_52550 [Calothrix sp. NIES-4071]|nr:hypothetical protein NIES4071_52550 [Calothrix sp. NIES-4071]BAZ59563.1 hypothetical protein NIES4105_52500 [Calothrix sp. NIES-4105]